MALTDNLKGILARQQALTHDLESEYAALSGRDFTRENAALKDELAHLKADHEEACTRLAQKTAENHALKNALHAQIYNEKVRIVNASRQKFDVYFASSVEGHYNRLTGLENSVRSKIRDMNAELTAHQVDLEDDLYVQLGELSLLLDTKVTRAKELINSHSGIYSAAEAAEFEALKNEQIDARVVNEIAKKNSFESFVGLNLLNKVGILLIVLGVIVATRYTYFTLPDMVKGILAFALGGALLVVGELLNRKKPTIFSLGITAGGVAVLYVALVSSYFFLGIVGMYTALGLCVLITAVAFLLSTRYNAQVILAFALIGGYLPLLSIDAAPVMVYSAMAYFVVLNLFALSISFQKKWTFSAYIGLVLNIGGSLFITFLSLRASAAITISYLFFAFLVYTLIPLFSTHSQNAVFKVSDTILLAVNTICSSLIIYFAFYLFNLQDFSGGLAVAFAAIYLLLGRYVEKTFAGDKRTSALFYLTGFAFVVLVVPFQFGTPWLTLGWLAEGTVLLLYGILQQDKQFKRLGAAICGLCLISFLLVDLTPNSYLFPQKYFAITLASLAVLACLIYKKTLSTTWEKYFKYAAVANLWLYSCYVILWHLPRQINLMYLDTGYLCSGLALCATILIAYIAPRIKILCDGGIKLLSIIFYGIGIAWLMLMNGVSTPFMGGFDRIPMGYTVLGSALLLLLSLLSVLAVFELMKCVVHERRVGVEWFPLVVSAYFVLILTQNLITQYRLSFASAAISIIYVVTALAWIVLGFVKRYSFLRRFGLGLSVLSVVKLFLIDLSSITQGYQIVSYFALGIALVAISLVYQYFNKRLELNIHEKIDT